MQAKTGEENKARSPAKKLAKRVFQVKLRVNSDRRQVRKYYLQTKEERAMFINAILNAQGLDTPLE